MPGVEIVGYEGLYTVTKEGLVWSCSRFVKTKGGGQRKIGGHFLKPQLGDEGYFLVVLMKEGKRKNCRIHRLVATTFLGANDNDEVNHKSGVKTENNVENLEWVTHQDNMQHAHDHGLIQRRKVSL